MIKIDIHPITYFFLISILLCGFFNYFLIISIILLIHDLGHIIVMKMFKIKIFNIVILPFGSLINSKINYNQNSNVLLLIAIAGILMQLFLYLVFNVLNNLNIINSLSYSIFLYYNRSIIIFNALPIIPLDGSKILLSLLERIMPYKIVLKLGCYISLILGCIFLYKCSLSLNIILISLFLFMKTYEELLNHNYIFNRFLLERYLNESNYKRIKYINSIKKIYKNKYNFINNQKEWAILAKMFDN